MKSIPIALQSHLDQDATTLCQLVRVVTKAGVVMGFTDLDADVIYDDGNGPVTYIAENGFTPSRHQASADMAVDNAELSGVVQSGGITEAQIRAGLFDYAKVRIYRVNYMNLANGHEILASGTAGETHFSASGWKTEFRSLTQQLKQPISNLYSLTCRVPFGSAKCGKAFTWVSGTVTSVGANARLTFTGSTTGGGGVASVTVTAGGTGYTSAPTVALTGGGGSGATATATLGTGANAGKVVSVTVTAPGTGYTTAPAVSFTGGAGSGATATATASQPNGHFELGVVEWLTGNNTGAQMEVSSHVDGVLTLALPMVFAIAVGDTFRVRKDCSKVHSDATNGCTFHWGTAWPLHFRGEPLIPVSDGGSNMAPGAQITRA